MSLTNSLDYYNTATNTTENARKNTRDIYNARTQVNSKHDFELPPESTPVIYLKCLEIACIADLAFKVITISMNWHPFMQLVTRVKSPKCHKIFQADEIGMFLLKVLSLVVMTLGVKACLQERYKEFKLFKCLFYSYCGAMTLMTFALAFEAVFFSCSMLKLKAKALLGAEIVAIGGFLIMVYCFAWRYFIVRSEKYLVENDPQMLAMAHRSELPKSYNTFERVRDPVLLGVERDQQAPTEIAGLIESDVKDRRRID